MNKIKKLIIFFSVVVLFSTFTSPSYAFGGAFFRGIGKGIGKIFEKSVKGITKNVDVKRYSEIFRKAPGSKRIYEPVEISKTLEGTGSRLLEGTGSKLKDDNRIIKNIAFFTAGGTIAIAGIDVYHRFIDQVSYEDKEEMDIWPVAKEELLGGIVKVISDNNQRFGAGFFINSDTILTSYHVVNSTIKKITTIIVCKSVDTPDKYILDKYRGDTECKSGFVKSTPLTMNKNTNKKICLSKGGDLEYEMQPSLGKDIWDTVESLNVCKQGYIIKDKDKVQIKLFDASEIFGDIIATDTDIDIALIRIDPFFTPGYHYDVEPAYNPAGRFSFNFAPLQFNNYFPLKIGFNVWAVGHPVEYDNTWTKGIISAFRNSTLSSVSLEGNSEDITYIQTSAEINKGNSGGPLLYKGKIVGVNSKKAKDAEGISFAVYYMKLLEFLKKNDIEI